MIPQWIKDLPRIGAEAAKFSKDAHAFRAADYYSQTGEDLIIEHILQHIGPIPAFVVDIGASDGYNLSNVRRFLKAGFEGLLFDGNNRGNAEVIQTIITAGNVNDVLRENGCPEEIGVLSLDVDSMEYWILKAIEIRASLIVVEFNGSIDPVRAVTVPLQDGFVHDLTNYYGCSLLALKKMMATKGYALIHHHASLNAFFVPIELAGGYDCPVDYKVSRGFPEDKKKREWMNV